MSPDSKTNENSTEIPPLVVDVTAPRRTLFVSSPVSAAKASLSARKNVYAGDCRSLRPFRSPCAAFKGDASSAPGCFEPNTACSKRLPTPVSRLASKSRRAAPLERVSALRVANGMANSSVNTNSVDPWATSGHGGGAGGGGEGGDGAMYGGGGDGGDGGGDGGDGGGDGGGGLYPSSITAYTPNRLTVASA